MITKLGQSPVQASYGQLQIDMYGLSTATATWYDHSDRPTLPGLGDAHPIWTELKIERIRVDHQQTHWEISADYAGVIGTPEAVYELDSSAIEEPIETHPDFEDFAGTPEDPLVTGGKKGNEFGAVFNQDTGAFEGFVYGDKRGVRGYLAPGAVWRMTQVQSEAPVEGVEDTGVIDPAPYGPIPAAGTRNWLYTGMTYEQRGGCYTVRYEWKLSGRRGWDADIYASF
jgi:hypothetical protein